MRTLIKLILIISLLWFSNAVKSETSVTDSLQKLANSTVDSIKLSALSGLTEEYTYTNPSIALKYAKQAESLADKMNLQSKKVEINMAIGIIYYEKGEYYQARTFNEKALDIAVEIKDSLLIARAYGNIGNTFLALSDYESALTYFRKALEIFEFKKNMLGLAMVNGTIGNLYFFSEKYDEALQYYNKSNTYFEKIDYREGIAINLMNIGAILKHKKQYPQALENLSKAYTIFTENELVFNAAQCLANIGNCYSGLNEHTKAESYIKNAIEQLILVNADESLAVTYNDLGNVYLKQKKHKEALLEFQKALTLAEQSKREDITEKTFKDISALYEETKDFENAIKYKNKYINLHDSILKSEQDNSQARLLTEFASERKDKEIIIKEAELKKQQVLIISLITGLFLFLLLLYFSFTRYRIKKKANIELTYKNAEITQQKEEITTQKEEIEAQKDEIEKSKFALQEKHNITLKQKDEIFRQKKDITDSINYAKRIQTTLLAGNDTYKKIMNSGFCYFKPRDIVSGDFYWINQVENHTIIIAADCTGHGVPGAFMSIIGITFLNEIINEKKITVPADILNILREKIIFALKSTSDFANTKDGMDMAICSINQLSKELTFAGANNPVWIVRSLQSTVSAFRLRRSGQSDSLQDLRLPTEDSHTFDSELPPQTNLELIEIKGDKQPIGIYENMRPFTNHNFQLTKGDTIYLMSDGFADQFGGTMNKKLKSKNFKELILEVAERPIEMQQALLEMQFEKWKGSNDQVDDVLVIGYQIN